MKPIIFYCIGAPLQIISFIFCTLFINWWLPIFSDVKGNLPAWAKWFTTFDNTLDAGVEQGLIEPTRWKFLDRVLWLYRNTSAGFPYYVLGVPFIPEEWEVTYYEPRPNGEFTFKARSKDGYWNYRYVGKYFGIETGWKAWNMTDGTNVHWKTTPWGPEWRVPLTIGISVYWRK